MSATTANEDKAEKKPWGYKNKVGRLFLYTPILEKQRKKFGLEAVMEKPKAKK